MTTGLSVTNGNTTYTDSNGTTHVFLGAWDPNAVYNYGAANNGDVAGIPVVEYDGGFYEPDYYSQDVSPLVSSETLGTAAGAYWITLAAPTLTPKKPNGPTGVTAGFVSASTVSLTWQAALVMGVGDVSDYNIYESTSNPGANPSTANMTLVGTSTTPTFTVTGLAADQTYYFAVDAVDPSGFSPLSSANVVSAPAATAVTTTDMNPDSGKTFSPFIDLTQPSANMLTAAVGGGLRDFTLAFMNSADLQSTTLQSGSLTTGIPTPNDGNYVNGGAVPTLSLGGAGFEPSGVPVLAIGSILSTVQEVESEGGTVTVAIGGYTGRDPAMIAAEYAAFKNGTPFSYSATPVNAVAPAGEVDPYMVTVSGGPGAPTGSSAYNTGVAVLQGEYQSAITSTGAKAITFDIENDSVPDEEWSNAPGYWAERGVTRSGSLVTPGAAGSIEYQQDVLGTGALAQSADAIRNAAIVALQQANPGLAVSFTLAVTPTGLSSGGTGENNGGANGNGGVSTGDNAQLLVTQAIAAGVKLSTINIMAMDYGVTTIANPDYNAITNPNVPMTLSLDDSTDGGQTNMATAAEEAAQATENFLLLQGLGSIKVEVTPMIGQNDTAGEVFTLADAMALEKWAAQTPWVSGLGEWSINRDQSSANTGFATSTGSGMGAGTQTPYEFAQDFDAVANAATVATMAANLSSLNAMANGFSVGDTRANLANGLAALEADVGHIDSIYSTDVVMNIGVGRFIPDQTALNKIIGGFAITGDAATIEANIAALEADQVNINTVAAVDGVIALGYGRFQPNETILNKITAGFSINGISATLSSHFDAIAADSSHINTVSFADPNPVVSLTAAQTVSDASLLSKLTGNYALDVKNTNGSTTITGFGAGLSISGTAGGGDTITGNGAGDTFVFQAHFGHDTVTDFSSHLTGSTHDTISLSQSEFTDFATMLQHTTYAGSGASATATITSSAYGDQLVLNGMTQALMTSSSSDFKFA